MKDLVMFRCNVRYLLFPGLVLVTLIVTTLLVTNNPICLEKLSYKPLSVRTSMATPRRENATGNDDSFQLSRHAPGPPASKHVNDSSGRVTTTDHAPMSEEEEWLEQYFENISTPTDSADSAEWWSDLDDKYDDDDSYEDSTSTMPKVVWLLSFPNSGTSYTLKNVEKLSNRTTATNYAAEYTHGTVVPVFGSSPNGPFVHDTTLQIPQQILTKTHCGGYCNEYCLPRKYVHTVESFEKACTTGSLDDVNGQKTKVSYSLSLPTKAVHLIRNPFDNLVARLHLSIKKKRKYQQNDTADAVFRYNDSKEGMDAWCAHVDEHFVQWQLGSPLLDNELLRRYENLPCRAEWFRYVQWHTHAVEVTKRLRLPVHHVYYESYSTDFNGTVQALFDFLELPMVNAPYEFIPDKTYLDFYEPEVARLGARFVQESTTPDAWLLLRHYFDGWINDDE